MRSLIQADKTSTTRAIVEPHTRIYVEPPSNTSNSENKESEVLSKSYVEFRAGEVNYPQSESGSQSPDSAHKELPTGSRKTSQLSYINGADDPPGVQGKNELDLIPLASPSVGKSLRENVFFS